MSAVELHSLTKRFGPAEVIHSIDLHLNSGELSVFVGPSGCGKSTLLRLIAGLEDPSAGRVVIGEEEVTDRPPARRGIAMVFQSYALYPHMNVFDNMAFGLKLARGKKAEIAHKVRAAARTLQIEGLLDKRPRELSGGQRQRVAIGRAIVREPKVFLFDEPLSNLDAALRVQMRQELAELQRRLAATMVYVTHDQVEAMTLGDRIVVLNAGRVEQVGAPLELYHRPANRFVAGFIGSPQMNFLEGRYAAAPEPAIRLGGGDRLQLSRASDLPDGAPVTLGVRPEHLAVADHGLRGSVLRVERLGSESYLLVQTAGGPVTVRAAGDSRLGPGDPVALAAQENTLRLFSPSGQAL